MASTIRLVAALLGLLSLPALVPAFAQTPAPAPRAPAAPAAPVAPAAPAPRAPTINAAPSPAAAAAGTRIDINGATEQQLDALPGIGPVRSKAIVAGRPYTDLQDLVTKKVLTKGVFDGAKGRMALANINTSSAAELAKTLPGIGDVRAKAIVAGRPYAGADDLVRKNILTQAVFDKMKDLVAY